MNTLVGYGKNKVEITIPDDKYLGTLVPNEVKIDLMGMEEVARSLQEPIGSSKLSEIVRPGEKIVIVTSDVTRPIPSYKVLPPVLDELTKAGIPDDDITVVFALGSHGGHSEERKDRKSVV